MRRTSQSCWLEQVIGFGACSCPLVLPGWLVKTCLKQAEKIAEVGLMSGSADKKR